MVFRNGVFTQIPFGLTALLLGLAMRFDVEALNIWAVLAALAFLVTGLIFVVSPPAFIKPRWISDREAEIGRSPSTSPLERVSWWMFVALIGFTTIVLTVLVILAPS